MSLILALANNGWHLEPHDGSDMGGPVTPGDDVIAFAWVFGLTVVLPAAIIGLSLLYSRTARGQRRTAEHRAHYQRLAEKRRAEGWADTRPKPHRDG